MGRYCHMYKSVGNRGWGDTGRMDVLGLACCVLCGDTPLSVVDCQTPSSALPRSRRPRAFRCVWGVGLCSCSCKGVGNRGQVEAGGTDVFGLPPAGVDEATLFRCACVVLEAPAVTEGGRIRPHGVEPLLSFPRHPSCRSQEIQKGAHKPTPKAPVALQFHNAVNTTMRSAWAELALQHHPGHSSGHGRIGWCVPH